MIDWVRIEKKRPPMMVEVLVWNGTEIKIAWDESMPGEEPSFCSHSDDPDYAYSVEGITHWFPLPELPFD